MDTYILADKLNLVTSDGDKIEFIDPDTIFVEDPNHRTFTWYKDFAIQTSMSSRFTHSELSRYLKYPKLYDEKVVVINTGMETPDHRIDGRFGYLRDDKGKKYPVISTWNEARFKDDKTYYDVIVRVLHKLFNFNLSDLIVTVGYTVLRYNNKKLSFGDTDGEKRELLDLKKQYHTETDPLKKRAIGLKIGIVPKVPSKFKVPVIGDSYMFNDLVELLENRMLGFRNLPDVAPYGFVVFNDGTFVIVKRVGEHIYAAGTDNEGLAKIIADGGVRISSSIGDSYMAEIVPGKVSGKARNTASDLAQFYNYGISFEPFQV